MNDKIRQAFDQVQAENELKDKTKDFIFQKTKGYKQAKTANFKYLASAFACVAFLLIGGYWLYFTPTVQISIDINPSVELGVNRFNRIISFESYNDDGDKLTDSLDIKFMDYSEAVNKIIDSEEILTLLENDEVMTIAVVGTDNLQSEEVLSNMQSCTAGRDNTYCYYTHSEEVEKAHESGLSYGKYKAFLELQKLDPTITVEEIQSITMREIRERISQLSGNVDDNGENSRKNNGASRENHSGNGSRHRGAKGRNTQ